MKSRFRRSPIVVTVVLILGLLLFLLVTDAVLASEPSQQSQTQGSSLVQLYCCTAVLIVAVPVTIWGRNKIRSEAAHTGLFSTTVNLKQPSDVVVNYINKNYDRSPKGERDWSKKWFTKNPPRVQLSTWYPRYWENCFFMIMFGILPYIIMREIMGGRSEKISVEILPGEDGGSIVNLSSEGKVGYQEAQKLANALQWM